MLIPSLPFFLSSPPLPFSHILFLSLCQDEEIHMRKSDTGLAHNLGHLTKTGACISKAHTIRGYPALKRMGRTREESRYS